jgi:hypothetical protein
MITDGVIGSRDLVGDTLVGGVALNRVFGRFRARDLFYLPRYLGR